MPTRALLSLPASTYLLPIRLLHRRDQRSHLFRDLPIQLFLLRKVYLHPHPILNHLLVHIHRLLQLLLQRLTVLSTAHKQRLLLLHFLGAFVHPLPRTVYLTRPLGSDLPSGALPPSHVAWARPPCSRKLLPRHGLMRQPSQHLLLKVLLEWQRL